ncbi:polycystin-2-like [Ostrea edulis]|uniref:polycystin-2-like n=1 Tax=Ostrea edulis TaxID=37623 RepID=UPI0024AFE5E5|nr:polycystin-2-like [Ostrea edulis]
MQDSDTEEYCLEWTKLTPSCAQLRDKVGFTSNSWKYTDAEEIWGTSQMGQHGTYDGGGYLLKFTKNRYQAHAMLSEIEDLRWIDRGSRAVFIEFTLYNPNLNIFIYSRYLAEFLETGGVLLSVDSSSFRSVVSADMIGSFVILCYLIFSVCIIASLFKLLYKIKRKGCREFIKVTWNCVNVLLVILGFITIVFYFVRLTFTKRAMQLFYDDKLTTDNKFINFNHIVIWDYAVNSVFALVVFISTLRFLKLLGYNKRFTQITTVVAKAGGALCSFGVIFALVFLGFASLGTLMLGVQLKEYKTFLYTCGTLSNTFIGKNKLNAMVVAAPLFAYVYFLTYTVFVIMILVSICAAILNSSISNVKATVHQETEKIGISHVFKKLIHNLFGLSNKNKMKSAKEETKPDVFKSFSEEFSTSNFIRLLHGCLHNELSRTSLLQGRNRDRKSNTIKSPPPPRNTRHLQNMRRSVFPFVTDKEMDESVVNINEISVYHNSNIDVRFI